MFIYVAFCQKASSMAQAVTTLQERGATEYTIVVAETANSLSEMLMLPERGLRSSPIYISRKAI